MKTPEEWADELPDYYPRAELVEHFRLAQKEAVEECLGIMESVAWAIPHSPIMNACKEIGGQIRIRFKGVLDE